MTSKIKGKRNMKRLQDEIEIVVTMECAVCNSNLAVHAVLPETKDLLSEKSFIAEMASFPDDFDYTKLAYGIVYKACFRLLASGRLHLYRGMLSPVGNAVHSLFQRILVYYDTHNMLEGSTIPQQLEVIGSYIDSVG